MDFSGPPDKCYFELLILLKVLSEQGRPGEKGDDGPKGGSFNFFIEDIFEFNRRFFLL